MSSISRREILMASAAALLSASATRPALAQEAPPAAPVAPLPTPDPAQTLWYNQPAAQWVEALPVGNGRLGAMVFGGISMERLQLNEDTFYAGGPYDDVNPEAKTNLPQVRELIFQGKYREAEALAGAKLMAKPLKQMPYQTLGDAVLLFQSLDTVHDYHRRLDLDTAVTTTRLVSGGGAWSSTHTREVFASAPDQVIVTRLSANKPGLISANLSLLTPQNATLVADGPDGLLLTGISPSRFGIEGRLKFAVRLKVIASGGTVRAGSDGIVIDHADEAVVLITAATGYRRYDDISADPAALTAATLAQAAAKPYARLLADHVAEHQRLYRRVALDLGTTPAAGLPTDERVRAAAPQDDPALAALYFNYGRYLLISSSRPGGQPANLQGIWNEQVDPPWESKWTININTEMNYWPAELVDLGECVQPLVGMLKDLSETGARAARDMYGAGGWMAHHNTDVWRVVGPPDGPKWGLWPMGGAWLCRHLWDHYDYGRDKAFLADIYPILKGASQFFLDTLLVLPGSDWLVTNPSLSPENVHPLGTTLCAGPAMDRQILRDLFASIVRAGEILGKDADFRAKVAAARERLPPDRIGGAGQLQEWLEDWDMQAPEIHHRHVSHLYAVYPSDQITRRDTPDLIKAARKTLEIRGDDATGWGLGWRLNLWARLGDGDHAHAILKLLLGPDRTYPNLFDAHPPFQIDGNFGGTAGMVEMLVQSIGDDIELLPALPRAWGHGSLRGVRVRGQGRLDLVWKDGTLAQAALRNAGAQPQRWQVRLGEDVVAVTVPAGGEKRVALKNGRLALA
ncbi:glycoside hydrolase family 95 protein [Nitrospirillum amazonense]|uniref:glycoside hydrolase family 95 protein n=1 Tax=Nitrospirillum amazonense TaxID=28077 RepID=UPI0024122396|nr:glycoside hydrolase family 95 protein [Nitrospirillum amazonense]MDG3443922.1 glycoside hydrolase family 95 protein [Nitrospirillum amazonense]